jgi:hypothetical protein
MESGDDSKLLNAHRAYRAGDTLWSVVFQVPPNFGWFISDELHQRRRLSRQLDDAAMLMPAMFMRQPVLSVDPEYFLQYPVGAMIVQYTP